MDFVKRKNLGKIQVFGEECLNEDGSIMSFAEQAAVITHYLKLNHNLEFTQLYEKKAEGLMRLWQDFIIDNMDHNTKNQSLTCDSSNQRLQTEK